MKGFAALIRLQLKLRLYAFRPSQWLPKQWNKLSEWKSLLIGLLLLITFGSLLVGILYLESALITAFSMLGMESIALALTLMICMVLTLVLGFFYATSVLYLSRDNSFLASLPVRSRTVFSAKFATVLAGEMGMALLLFLPTCILYGLRMGQDVFFYLRALLVSLTLPCLPVAIATLLATVLIRFSSMWKNRERWTIIGGFALMFGAIALQMQMINVIPEDAGADFFIRLITDNSAMIAAVTGWFPPVMWGSYGLTGAAQPMIGYFLLFIGTSLGALALVIWLVGGRYQRLSILQSEAYAKEKTRKLRDGDYAKTHKPIYALFLREWRELVRTPIYALNGLTGIVVMPLMLAIFSITGKSSGADEFTALLANLTSVVPVEILALILAGFMVFACSINPGGTTAVSREGARIGISRMIPVAFRTQVMAKQLFGFSISVAACIVTGVTFMMLFPSLGLYGLAALAIGLAAAYAFNAMGLALDILHPKFNWRNETEAIKQNMNVLLQMLLVLVILFLMGFGVVSLLNGGASPGLLLALTAGVMVLFAGGMQLWLMKLADKTFGKLES